MAPVPKTKEQEADEIMKRGEKKLGPTLLRWSADYDTAVTCFEQAATLYRSILPSTDALKNKAKTAFEKASHAQEKTGSAWHAAKHLESAGALAKELKDMMEVEQFFRRAATLYVEAGRSQAAAEALAKGAKLLEGDQVEEAAKMYMDAFSLMEEENKEMFAKDMYFNAIGLHLKKKNFDEVTALLMRWAEGCDRNENPGSQSKAYLSVVIVHLFAGDAATAESTFRDCTGVATFQRSAEARTCEELLDAYRDGDEARIKKIASTSRVIMNVENVIARLGKKLPNGKDLAKMARSLGGKPGGRKADYGGGRDTSDEEEEEEEDGEERDDDDLT